MQPMQGLHIIADLFDCRCPAGRLLDAPGLEDFAIAACRRQGLVVVGRCFHQFRDDAGRAAGVTGTVVLAGSHFALHTWPEIAAVTLDIYVCNFSGDNSERARALFRESVATFAPDQVESREVARGKPATESTATPPT